MCVLQANLPIAAPSANKFGHVSPTSASHVFNDLSDCPIIIVNGETETNEKQVTCSVGIESTVVKISASGEVIEVLRSGGTSSVSLLKALKEEGFPGVRVVDGGTSTASRTEASGSSQQSTHGDTESQRHESPGQLLRHYAPHVSTYLLPPRQSLSDQWAEETATSNDLEKTLAGCALIDFAGSYAELRGYLGFYTDLSSLGDVSVARQRVYSSLREAEQIPGISNVLLSLPTLGDNTGVSGSPNVNVEHTDSLRDRLFRAASGMYLSKDFKDQRQIWGAILALLQSRN